MRLTLIEADADAAGWLAARLSGDGFRVARVPLSQQFQALAGEAPDAALLDMGSTRLAASAIVRGLRDRGLDRPLLVVSGSGDWRRRNHQVANPARTSKTTMVVRKNRSFFMFISSPPLWWVAASWPL